MPKCSFCGMNKDNVIIGQNKETAICLDCVTKIATANKKAKNMKTFSKKVKDKAILKPYEIVAELNKYIIGQDEAKRTIAVETYNHFKRINNQTDVELRKSNMLILGPTGAGKTAIVERLAKILKLPLVIEDATSLTSAGYVGLNVENCLARLYMQADKNLELTQKGIVYIDEIDKIAASDTGNIKDVGGKSVQQAFLKMMESAIIPVEINKEDTVMIDTSNILFIFGGAFEGLTDIIKTRVNSSSLSIGFSNEQTDEEKIDEDELLKNVTPDDIFKFGFIKEFIGRIPIIVTLNKLTKEDLNNILLNTENSLIKEYKYLFSLDGVDIEFSKDAINYIIDEALKKGTGARGLRSIFSKQLNQLSYDVTENPVDSYTITKKTLEPKDVSKNLKKTSVRKNIKKKAI